MKTTDIPIKFEPKANKNGYVPCTIKLRDSKDVLINCDHKTATVVLVDYTYDVANNILISSHFDTNSNYKLVNINDGFATFEVYNGDIKFIVMPITMLNEVKEDDITRKDTNVPSTTRRTKNTK